jgi:hypothetical protein
VKNHYHEPRNESHCANSCCAGIKEYGKIKLVVQKASENDKLLFGQGGANPVQQEWIGR